MSPFEKLLMKKKEEGKSMDPLEKKAKLGNLAELRDEMSGMMKGDLMPKAKVEVAAENPEDLKEGLEVAKDVVEGDIMPGAEVESEDELIGDNDGLSEPEADLSALSPEEAELLKGLLAKLNKSELV